MTQHFNCDNATYTTKDQNSVNHSVDFVGTSYISYQRQTYFTYSCVLEKTRNKISVNDTEHAFGVLFFFEPGLTNTFLLITNYD